jgi:hypothetical protein
LQPSFVGSKQIPPMKKEATPKRQGVQNKTTDEKRGNPQTAWGSKQGPLMKKDAVPKMQGAQNKDLR